MNFLPFLTRFVYTCFILTLRAKETFIRKARTSIGKTQTSEMTPETPPDIITSIGNQSERSLTYQISVMKQIETWVSYVPGN